MYQWMEIIREIRIYKMRELRYILRISYGYLTEYLTDILRICYGYLTDISRISHGYLTEYLNGIQVSSHGLFSSRNLYVYTYVTGFLCDRALVCLDKKPACGVARAEKNTQTCPDPDCKGGGHCIHSQMHCVNCENNLHQPKVSACSFYPQLAQNALQKSANLRPTLAFSESNRFLGIKLIILNARLHYLQ